MRKLNTRSVLLIILVVLSLSSYIYLNSVSVDTPPVEEASQLEELESERSEIILPDVQLIKKALEAGRRLIPAT